MLHFCPLNIKNMKKTLSKMLSKILFITFSGLLSNSFSQTVLIDPSNVGGFELPGGFAGNGWTIANNAGGNQWVIGTTPIGFTNNSAFISNDAGVSNAYTNTTATVVHFYRDVTIPAGETNISLSFDWLANGEAGFWDALMVSVAPTTYTPTATTTSLGTAYLAGVTEIGRYWLQTTTQNVNINIPLSAINNCSSAQTVRIIFSWKNDTSGGTNPPAAVDNISMVSSVPNPSSAIGTYTIDNTLPTAGSNFASFNAAIAWLNSVCISNPIVFNVTSGQIFTEVPRVITASGTAGNTITFQKSGFGANPILLGTNGVGTVDAGITISGGDYFTFDGIDVVDNPTNLTTTTQIEYGYLIRNASAINGAQFNIVKNCNISLLRTYTTVRSVLQSATTTGGGFVPTALTGANSENQYLNITVNSAFAGIYLFGTAAFADINCKVLNCTIGNSTANSIGSTTVAAASFGIRADNQNGFTISGNTITNVVTGTQCDGINIIAFQGTCSVNNNRIRGIRNSGTASTTVISGVRATHSTAGTNALRVYNNAISNITSGYTGAASATRVLRGINISGTGGAATQSYVILNNSVSIDGSASLNISSSCMEIATTSGPTFTVANNIFANFTGTQTGLARHYVYVSTSATLLGNTGTSVNNNVYFVLNNVGTTGFIGRGNTTDFATLANWQANYAGQDIASVSLNPNYIDNAQDLHSTNVALNGIGQAHPAYVTTDLDNSARTDFDPGAYIINTCSGAPTAGTISGANAVCSGNGTTLTLTGPSSEAGISYQWASSAAPGGPYSNLGTSGTQATGVPTAPTYYVVTVTCALSGLFSTTTEFTVNVNANPVVSVTPSSATYCNPGTAVSLTASGALNYAWSPSTGLSANIGATVAASPSANTNYTVSGSDANGCIGTATSAITVSNLPVISSVTSTPASFCSIGNSQLNAVASVNDVYAVSSTPYSIVPTPGTGVTTLANTGVATTALTSGTLDDGGWNSQTLPFTFNFFGIDYTSFAVSTNGFIYLGATAPTFTAYGNAFPSTFAANPSIGATYSDLDFRTIGTINYFVSGTAPNRQLVINWSGGNFYNAVGAITTQLIIYETTNIIEVHTTNSTGTNTAILGIQNSGATKFTTAPGRNSTFWAVSTPDAYQFTPPAITYSWSPATFLSSTSITNPLATSVNATTTYTLSATSNGCTSTGTTTVTVNPLPSAPTSTNSAQCGGQIPTASVASTSGLPTPTFVWYDAAVSGTVLQTSTSTTYTSVIGATTTLYVSEKNMTTGCESALTPVTITVASADLVQASVNNATICIGQTVNLSVLNVNTTPLQSYTYSWSSTTGNGLNTSSGAAVTATPTAAGSYLYTVNGIDGGCSAVSTVNVTVNPFATSLSVVNVTCNGAANGTFTLSSSSCGTAPYSYSVDGGAFGAIPTNLTPGTYQVVTKDANGYTVAPQTITITEPSAITVPSGISNVAVCQNATSAQLTVPATATITVPVTFNLAAQPAVIGTFTAPTTVAGNPNVIATAALPALPAGATITSVTYTMNGLTPLGFSWGSDVFFGFSGAYSTNYASGVGAPTSATAFNYTNTFVGGTYNPAGGTVELNYYDQYDDNAGDECTFPTGAAAGTLTIIYTVPNPTVNWYSATTGGSLLGTGTPFQTVGTSVLSTTATPGTYTFYAEGTNGSCVSASRTAVTVTVNALPNVNAGVDQTVCAGTAVTLNGTVAGGTWSGPVAVTNGTAFTPPAGVHTFTYSVTNGSGCTNTDNVVVTVNALPIVNAGIDQTVCAGTAVTLNGTVAGGTWSGPLTINDGVAFTAPVGVHTFTYSVTNTNGCTSTDNVVVTVNALPIVNAGADQTVCDGNTVTLSGTVAGGTWSGPLTITDGVAFTAPVGVHTFTYSVTNTNGCTSTDDVIVTVNALPTVNAGVDQSVCDGNTVTLSGTVAGGTWSGPLTITDGVAFTAPVGVHTFTYSVTNTNGCTSTDDVIVTVNELPAVNAGVDQSVCDGNAVTLSGTVAGGTWSGPLTITDGVAFTAPVGVHTFTYSVTNTSGCTSTDDVIVTVNALPTVNAGTDQTICEGAAVTLSGTTAGGTWNGPVTITDGVAFNPPAGVHTFTYSVTNANGCTSTDDVVVTVNVLPTVNAGADQTVCEGTAVTLSGTVAGGTWSGPLTITDGVAFTAPVGVHTFTYSVTNTSGCTNTDDVVVTVNTVPVATATDNGDATITAGTAATYQWIDCATGTAIAGATSQTLTVTVNGTYAVIASNGSCSDTSDCVTIDYMKVSELSLYAISIYPNPTRDNVTVTMTSASASIEIIDAQGKLLKATQVVNGDKIDLSTYETGMYIFRVKTENGTSIFRVSKN
jgi:hypothetical protein